jgi:hypothetical protein
MVARWAVVLAARKVVQKADPKVENLVVLLAMLLARTSVRWMVES